jgi:hypothetical protein
MASTTDSYNAKSLAEKAGDYFLMKRGAI